MGYGAAASGGQQRGIKRVGTATIAEARSTNFLLDGPASGCDGDSGGPVFLYGDDGFPVLHGMILAALDGCAQTIALRVDAEFNVFIAPVVAQLCIAGDDAPTCGGLVRNGFESFPGHP